MRNPFLLIAVTLILLTFIALSGCGGKKVEVPPGTPVEVDGQEGKRVSEDLNLVLTRLVGYTPEEIKRIEGNPTYFCTRLAGKKFCYINGYWYEIPE